MNSLVFDIETVPDIEGGRHLYGLAEILTASEVLAALLQHRRERSNAEVDFLPLHLQRIVAISVILQTDDQIKIGSIGKPETAEPELIGRFFRCIDKYVPTLVSWNGSGFDLPVLHYRALLYDISAPAYWNIGDQGDSGFRWNNYLNRFHYRHMDLMDILAAYQVRAVAPLGEIALMSGLPGKLGITGGQVWDYFQQGKIEAIRHYCEIDVLNTYLLYLRFDRMRGRLNPEQYTVSCQRLRQTLQQEDKPHFHAFLAAWQS